MPGNPVIWIVDTSVFLNVLDVPQFNQDRGEVLANFESRINNGDTFLLPITTVIETGNHIARINNGNQRQDFAQKFSDQVLASIEGESPWKPLEYPEAEDVKKWLADFPNTAQAGVGLGDHIIIKQWKEQCSKYPAYLVKIWSLDIHLQGYECNH
ncbi:MAG: hypothetical protein H6558_07135 [Lewinellaceae bacterium]|nr:hypothetical protein [Lewinellaceae bacterium]MCB9287722.1 hypothetical protein [Lewinellaceae bacterium]